jgi:hypothetical protein
VRAYLTKHGLFFNSAPRRSDSDTLRGMDRTPKTRKWIRGLEKQTKLLETVGDHQPIGE